MENIIIKRDRYPREEMSSALSNETEKDVLPWLKLAEDLRLLELDCEVRFLPFLEEAPCLEEFFVVEYATNLCHG